MLSLFFVDQLGAGTTQELTGEEGHHAVVVMRLSVGEAIKIADGTGNWVSGTVTEVGKKSLKIDVAQRGSAQVGKPELIVVQAVTKSDRTKEMLELLTVAGADQIIPWQAERCISKWQSDSASKWQILIKEAAKQARRVKLPVLAGEVSTNQLVKLFKATDKVVVMHEGAITGVSQLNLSKVSEHEIERIILIIGPEGGISDAEISQLESAGAVTARMGELVLRSAHAGFAALAAIQTSIGRW
jgi:16S rRNA (uracil1498-N3)-methyltransferase